MLDLIISTVRSKGRRLLLACFGCAICTALQAQNGWTKIAPPTDADLWGVCSGGNQFVAVGTGGAILTSPNGTAWTARTSGTSVWLTAISYGNGTYVVVGGGGTILTSTDAIAWTTRSATGDRLNGVAYGNGRFLAVGENGTVRSSSDGIAWTIQKLPIDTWLRGITYGPDSFLIAAGDGTLCSTGDGVVFRFLTSLVTPIEALFYSEGTVMAAGSNSRVIASSDRITWITKSSPITSHLRGITKMGTSVLAVGEAGAVYSADFNASYKAEPTTTYILENRNLNAVCVGSTGAVIVGDVGSVFVTPPGSIQPPSISGAKLSSTDVYLGGSVTLSAKLSGSPPFTFQWMHAGMPIISGTADSLVVNSLKETDAGNYTLTVSNMAGSTNIAFSVPAPISPPSAAVDASFQTTYRFAPNTYSSAGNLVGLPDGRILVPGAGPELQKLNTDGSWNLAYHDTGEAGKILAPPIVRSDGRVLVRAGAPVHLKQFNSDGTIDVSFTADDDYGSPALLPDGKLVCVSINSQAPLSASVTRLNANGSRDQAFASFVVPLIFPPGGIYSVFYQSFATDARGRVYVAFASEGSHYSTAATILVRLSTDGTLDSTFATQTLAGLTISRMEWVAGKLCCQSIPYREAGVHFPGYLKLTETGELDASFPQFDEVSGDFDSEGGLVLISRIPDSANVELVRYDAGGAVEATFPIRFGSTSDNIFGLKRLPNGSFLAIGGFTLLNGVSTAGLARLSIATKDPATHLANLSIRTTAGTGDQTLIAGFVVAGNSGSRSVLIRGVGPGLVPLGLNSKDVIADPQISLFKGSSVVARNDNWDSSIETTANALGAFPLARNSKDAALETVLTPGGYAAHVTGTGGVNGTALVELYDADVAPRSSTASRLVNISGRAYVGTGDNVLIAGFVLSGNSTKRLLIRAIGPGLKKQGLSEALTDPELVIYHGDRVIASNDNWNVSDTNAFVTVGAFSLDSGSKDAALIVDLPSGVYSALVRGVGGSTGSALVEIYEVP